MLRTSMGPILYVPGIHRHCEMVLSLHKLDLVGQVLTQALFFLAVNSGKFRVDVQGALRFKNKRCCSINITLRYV